MVRAGKPAILRKVRNWDFVPGKDLGMENRKETDVFLSTYCVPGTLHIPPFILTQPYGYTS